MSAYTDSDLDDLKHAWEIAKQVDRAYKDFIRRRLREGKDVSQLISWDDLYGKGRERGLRRIRKLTT